MDLLTPRDVAARLHIGVRRARVLMSAGIIPSGWLGARLVTYEPVFQSWYAEQMQQARQLAPREVAPHAAH